MRVTNEVDVYELKGRDVKNKVGEERPTLVVSSHWFRQGFVVLEFGGLNFTVAAGDLMAAIAKAEK